MPRFDLTIAIFNNGGVLKEFFRLAEALGVKRSTVLHRIARTAGTRERTARADLRRVQQR